MNEKALPKTLQQAIRFFSDDFVCIEVIAKMRWVDGEAICPKCGGADNTFMQSRKVWQCKNKECKKQFSVKVGTIFEDSAIGLDKWLMAMWLLANAKNGISSYELHRGIGITQKSAWFVLHRVRLAMQNGSLEKLSGDIEADNTYIGGLSKNMHKSKRERLQTRSKAHQTTVLGMLQRKGRVRAHVVPNLKKPNLHPVIRENIERGATLITDEGVEFAHLERDFVRETVNHSIEYVRGNVHTNSIENFWSLLKRSIKGTYVSVSPAHLQKYVEEQVFRFNERKGDDQMRFFALLDQISGKRLTYNELIGYEEGC